MYNVGECGNENIKEVRLLFDMTKVRKVALVGVVALLGILYGASTHKVTTTADRNFGNGQYGVIRETHTEDIFGRQIDESEIEVLGYVDYRQH